MKTQLEKFIELYREFGIEPTVVSYDDGETEVLLHEGDNDKLVGYNCFYAKATFDREGQFLSQGFYEGP